MVTAHGQGAVGFEQGPVERDETQAGDALGDRPGRDEIVDEERAAQQQGRQIGQLRMIAGDDLLRRRDQAGMIGSDGAGRLADPADERQLHVAKHRKRFVRRGPKRHEADAARERLRMLAERLPQLGHVADDEALGPVAERQIDESGMLALHGQEVGDHAEDRLPRPRLRLFEQLEDLADADAEAFVTPQQAFEDVDPAGESAPILAKLRQRFLEPIAIAAFVVPGLPLRGGLVAASGQLLLQPSLGGDEVVEFVIDRRQSLGDLRRAILEPLPFARQVVDLRLAGDGLVLQPGGPTHHLEMLGLIRRRLMLHAGKLAGGRSEPGLEFVNRLAMAEGVRLRLVEFARRGFDGSAEVLHEADEDGRPAPALAQLGVEIGRQAVLVAQCRFVSLDLLEDTAQRAFLIAEAVLEIGEEELEPLGLRFAGDGPGGTLVELGAELVEDRLDGGQLAATLVELADAQGESDLAEPVAVLAVAFRLRRLGLHGLELLVDLVDDVLRPGQVLVDAFELAERLLLLRLEAADAGRLFEDGAAFLRRGLQEDVDLSLGDDAQVVVAEAAAEEEIALVLEASDLAVEEVFAFAGPVDAARDLDLLRVDGEGAFAVVEVHRHLGEAEAFAGGGAVEDDVGHLAAAEGLGGLFAEDPADGVDDVALAGAVGPDDGGDAGAELEHRLVGEALEADEFQTPEHASSPGRGYLTDAVRQGGITKTRKDEITKKAKARGRLRKTG